MEDQALDTVKVHNPDIPGTFMIVNAVDAGDYQIFEEPQGGDAALGKPLKGSEESSSENLVKEGTEGETEEPQVDVEQLRKRLKKATGA